MQKHYCDCEYTESVYIELMFVTCFHEKSKKGFPVIINDEAEVLDYPEGLTLVLDKLGWSRDEFAKKMGYKSARSVEKFWQGTTPPANILNLLEVALEAPPKITGRDEISEIRKAHFRAERFAKRARVLIIRALMVRFRAASIVESVKSRVYAHNEHLKPVLTPKEIKNYVSLHEYHIKRGYEFISKDILHRAGILYKKPKRTKPQSQREYKYTEPPEEAVMHLANWMRDKARK